MSTGADDGTEAAEQLSLLTPATSARSAARAGRRPPGLVPAATDPVARVLVDTGLAHLDRPFEYLVPAGLDAEAVPGARVRVRFAGQDLDGFVVARAAAAEHEGRLAPVRRVVSPEPVLTPAVLAVAEELARAGAGTVMDVLRLAVPPRHAAAEKALDAKGDPPTPTAPGPPAGEAWQAYAGGPAFLRHLAGGGTPGATWLALPATDPALGWPAALAGAVVATVAGGRGAVVVVPDHRDLDRLDRALCAVLGAGRHVRLTAEQGPQARYTAFLKVLRGHVPVAIGTRSAAFAPVRDLGLVAWWDDGDDLHAEPRSPYPHVREVLLARARLEGAAVLSGGFARTAAVEALRRDGVLVDVSAPAATTRARVPRVVVAGEGVEAERDAGASTARLPSLAFRTARAALEHGPVLVQVPRRGYLPTMSCQTCRRPARCRTCSGPLAVPSAGGVAGCRWCGRPAADWSCPHCGGTRLRAAVVGARRTAEELGLAFRGTPVHTSGAKEVLARVAGTPALVIATPGAEPLADGGYAATLLLDAWALLDRPNLDAGEEALRRWLAAAALTRPGPDGGTVVLVGGPSGVTVPAVEALVRWAPGRFAERELDERTAVALPPARAAVVVEGDRPAVRGALAEADLPPGAVVLGPQPGPDADRARAVVLAPVEAREDLVAAWRTVRRERSARKEPGRLVVRVDPADLEA